MAKISELPPITGGNTRSEDLFVIVNLVQGDDGTSNITRKELVEAIQYEIFSRIKITGGTISGVVMSDSRLNNVEIDNSEIEDTIFRRGSIDDTVITNSDANNIVMTYSTFNLGHLENNTANNITITYSDFSEGTGNNNTFDNTTLFTGTANNFSIFNSTVNNSIITNSEFNDGTGNNVTLTNSTIDDSTITDSTANNLTIGFSSFADGTLSDSTANNLVINASTFNDGDINNSDISGGTADAVDITNSTYTDGTVVNADISDSDFTTGTITDSTANNVVITSSEFNDGTGNNVTLTNSTIDRSLISGSEIVDSEFTGTMENVVSTNMTIRSSTADGLGANNSTFENGGIEQSTFTGGVIDKSRLADFDMDLTKEFEAPMDEESYFAIRNEKTGDTEQISYKQLFDEVSKSTAQALKVHVDAASGDDSNLGTMLAPVKTLERAFELCLEKAGGELNRNAINNAVHISVGPGTYYTKGNLMLPDDCSCTSTAGQYATVIELLPGYENNNGILVGSGGYVQGFGYQNFKVDNFDFPEGGFAIAYRPGAKLLRSPYLRDSTQLSNFLRQDVEPPLNPYNSKGTLADLGQTFVLEANITGNSSTPADSLWKLDDEIQFSSGGVGYLSWDDSLDALQGTVPGDVANLRTIRVRNLKNGQGFAVGDTITSESGGTGKIQSIGIDDFPNRAVGRGGGCVLADRRVLDTDSLYTYVLCFGFTPRTQNGLGYVARDGAGVNGIGSLSIFVRCAFYALNGGQMTLNNSGTQFGDISMRAKGTTQFFAPKSTTQTIVGNTEFAQSIDYSADLVIDDMVDYLTSNTANGGLGYQEYDSEKCLRDSGIVLDGTGYDIALDTNYWGRLGGITYRSPISYVVPGEQLEETKGALEYLRDQTKQVFISGDSEINQRIETSFSELLNVLEYGEENINPIIWRDTSIPRTASRRLLQDNKELITGELIDWIENNDEFYAYDSKACRRDVSDYILPAVKNDMLFDTNYNSVTAGRAYYMMAAKTVMENQNNETVAAYERLKDQTNKLIDGDSYVASDRLDDSYDNILQILENKGTKFNPTTATYDPSTGLSVITLGGSKGLTVSNATYDPATGIMEATVGLKHEVKTGDHIWMKPESIIFSCNMGSGVQNHASPAAHHPYYNKPCPVIGVSATTVRLNVGTGGTGQVPHTFVSATPNAFTKGHGLSEGSYVLLKTGGLVFSCTRDNHRTRTGYPRAGDPAAGTPVEVLGANASKITIDVGKSAIVDEHKFVSALPNAVSTLGDNITWSNNSSIPAAKRDARKQLQANRTFLQDMIEGYVEDTYYRYDSNKCRRDVTQYILPAVERDILTGSNYNAIQTGIAYRAGTTLADNVINNQLPQTLGSMDTLKTRLNNTTVGFTPSDASYNPASGIMVATIGSGHGLVTGDHIRFAFEGIVHSCDAGSGVANHPSPQAHHPYYNKPCPIIAHDDTTITMQVGKSTNYPHTFVSAVTNAIMPADAVGAQFTPTTATYDPATGKFEATVGKHTLQPGDYVQFSDGGIVFSCDTGSGVQNDAVPAAHHPYFNHPCPVHSVTTNTIVMMVGTGGTGQYPHTFVSAADNSITEIIGLSDSASIHRSDEAIDKVKQILNSGNKIYTPSNATYNPVTGLTEITVGAHDLQIGDEVLLAPDSLTFTCATDGNATQHTYPTTTITSFTPTTASYVPSTGEFTANIGPHKLTIGDEIEFATRGITFTCELDGNLTTHSAPEPHHPFYKKPVKITSVDGDTIGCNVGAVANGGGVHTFVSAITNAIKGERQHPAYKKPVVVAQTSATSFTVNVGPSSDVSVHTFVSATANSVKTAKYISTHTPYNATYDASTGEFVAFIGKHAFEAGDMIMLKPNSVIMTCDLDGGVTEHAAPAAHHPAYRTPVELLSVTADSITMNIGTGTGGVHTFVRADVGAIDSDALVFTDPASYVKHYTPTTATYNAVSGASVITIPGHDLTTEDYVEFTPYSFTFTCAQDGNATEHSYPRKGDFNYRTPMQVIGVSGNDVTVQLIASSGGAHTFVSVAKECVSKVTYNSQGQYAREQLQQNKEYLAKDVSAYLDTQYFTFDGEKCTRDSGFILDAVRRDIATDGNWNSQFMGLGYVTGSAGANKVINDQLTETLASVAFLKAKVAADPNVTGTALTRANQSFDEITTIMGGGSASATRWGAVAALSDGHNNAGNQILLNKAFIQAEVAAYIAQEFPTLTYDNAACQRDTGYLVDSIIQDVKFGGNTCSVNFARLYFENAVSVLPADQIEPTYKTWEHIAEVVWQIIRDITVTVTTGNAVSQDESGSDYGFEIANLGRDRVNIITKVISENTLDFLPKYIEPNYELDMVDAADAIDGQSENLSLAVIDMLRDDHNGLPFKSAVCERDIGIMVDALSRDIEYGGNENLLEVFDYYFRKFDSQSADYEQQRSTNVLPIEVKGQFRTLSNYEDTANVSGLREAINVLPYEQRLPTQLAFRRLAGQVGPIVAGVQQAQTNPKFTATDASYDPATGIFVATIPAGHLLDTGSVVYLKPNGFTFSCDMGQGGGVTNHAAPQPHHPFYNKGVKVISSTATTITLNVGDGGSGQQPHTFVSALADSISTGPYHLTDGTAASVAKSGEAAQLIYAIADLIDNTNIEESEMPTLVKASFDPNRTLARKQLQRNRDFIIDELQGYLQDRYYVFDGDKCKRDVNMLIDAVKTDILTGSNHNAVLNGTAYRINTVGTNKVINEQLTETVKGIEFARDKAIEAVTDGAMKIKTAEAFNEIIDIMVNGRAAADAIVYGTEGPGPSRLNGRSQLLNNRTFLIAEMTAWLAANRPSHSYDVAKCERDTGYALDAIAHDIQFGGNFATLNFTKLYFENGVNVGLPADQIEPSAAAFAHLGDCANLIVQDTDIGGLKSAGNTETQNVLGANAGVLVGGIAESLFDITSTAISSGTMLMAPSQVFPDPASFGTVNQTAYAEIEAIKDSVGTGLLAYLSEFFQVLPYSETKCRRDTGYIIDAISHDIQYGGNAATVQTAGMYFENAVNTGLQIEQRMGTRDAFLHLAKIVEHVVGGKSITTTLFPRTGKYYTGDIVTKYEYWNGIPSYSNTAQDMATVGANPDTCIAARKLTEIVANAVDDNIETRNTIPERIDVLQTWMADSFVTSKEAVERRSDIFAEAVITYLSKEWNALSFPDAKCRRDIGYIIDSISHDIQHDTNFATLQSAGIYFENGVSVLPVDTQNQYADVLQLLGDAVEQVVQEIPVTNASNYTLTPQNTLGTAATATEGTQVHALVGIIEQSIRDNDTDAIPRPTSTAGWVDAELTAAASKIVDNTEELAADVTEFINSNFKVLDYSKAKCRRDTGYLLDAFSFDLNFGGNSASRWNADFYFWNQVYRLPEDQRTPTAKSYRQLGKICKDIVIGEYPGQSILGELGTEVESKKVEGLANIFYETQLYNDTKYLPVLLEADYTYSNSIFTDAQSIIGQRRKQLQKDTVRHVNSAYNFIDINLTRRDARNLLTAVVNDFAYDKFNPDVPQPTYSDNGSQNAVRTYTASFFNYDGTHVFPVFNPSDSTLGLKYKGSVSSFSDLSTITGMKPKWSYIVATDYATNFYAGDIYYWNGSAWTAAGQNNTDLLDAFAGAWTRMKTYINTNLAPDAEHQNMITGLFDDCLTDNILRPETLIFGSLVESIAHQFNGASAGVNRNALPLNFRNLGAAISAIASVLNENGGRIRWSGADELNNQYFARGLRINGRTGRIEGRPFTSSVRKLARRASNSRAVV